MKTKEKIVKKLKEKAQEPDAPMGDTSVGATSAGWHSIESLWRCPKEYQYEKVRGIRNPEAEMPDPFAIGQMMHVGKGRWFSKRFPTDEAVLETIRDEMMDYATKSKLPMSIDAQRRALKYFTEYVEFWRMRPKPKVVAAEYDLGPSPVKAGDPFFLHRTARLDDVSRYAEAGGALCIGESKTTSSTINDCIKQYKLHGQIAMQVALWKLAPQGEAMHGPVAGVMLDVIVKGSGTEKSKFGRQLIEVPDRVVNWYVENLRSQLRVAASIDWNSVVPRNITACTRMVGRGRMACPYTEMCVFGRSASAKYVMRDGSSLVTWKPSQYESVPPWE